MNLNSVNRTLLLLAVSLILLYFVPLSEAFNAVKVSIAIMIIAYGFSIWSFRKRIQNAEKYNLEHKIDKKHFKNVKKELESINENGVRS